MLPSRMCEEVILDVFKDHMRPGLFMYDRHVVEPKNFKGHVIYIALVCVESKL